MDDEASPATKAAAAPLLQHAHDALLRTRNPSAWSCNVCNVRHAATDEVLHCGQCDFDVCTSCAGQKVAATPAIAAAAGGEQRFSTREQGGVTLVTAHARDLNNNNLNKEFPLYRVRDSRTGLEVKLPEYDRSKPMCETCLRVFPSFSTLCKHRGKPCITDDIDKGEDVLVVFEKRHLPNIAEALSALGKPVTEHGDGTCSVLHPKNMVPLLTATLYMSQCTKYNLEEWYPRVQHLRTGGSPVTAPCTFLPLSREDLEAISGMCSVQLSAALGMPSRLKAAELDKKQNIEDLLTAVMQPGKKYFCRMSTRSPKDGVSLTEEEKMNPDPTARLRIKYKKLCITDPLQVLELITRSQRVFSDISFFFQYRIPGTSSDHMSIILRDWVDELPQDHEFRCFVRNRRVNAISQYHCYTVFPSLLGDLPLVTKMREAILAFHDTVKDYLPLPDYIIDIVVFPGMRCEMIELNPFGPAMSSGSALYNWRTDTQLLCDDGNRAGLPPIRILERFLGE
eukprot:TRINITY_DN3424_c0_g1_i3.p1 TRINITY_DN3424_c0_g1~~TRINITY_DN3424_c0_g1_i3.p1  ORF type:complete len:509 (+),score=141.39 TRINITY_DN3424_c0_g1_i3:263-1789(+)